jgi:hypothetical protein
MKWYHGSRFDFDEFKLKKGTLLDSDYINPIFLTSDYNFAKAYSGYKNPIIYTVEILTDKIFDSSKLPFDSQLYRYEIGKEDKKPGLDYELGFKLRDFLDNDPECEYLDTASIYNQIIGGDYYGMERVWFFEWLKNNDFDGCYLYETRIKNVFIFDPKKLKIISKEIPKFEKLITKFKLFENKNNFFVGYHGTNHDLKKDDIKINDKSDKMIYGPGFYIAKNEKLARKYGIVYKIIFNGNFHKILRDFSGTYGIFQQYLDDIRTSYKENFINYVEENPKYWLDKLKFTKNELQQLYNDGDGDSFADRYIELYEKDLFQEYLDNQINLRDEFIEDGYDGVFDDVQWCLYFPNKNIISL